MKFQLQWILIPLLLVGSSTLTTLSVYHNQYVLALCSILIFCCPMPLLSDGLTSSIKNKEACTSKKSFRNQGFSWNTLLTSLVYAWGSLTLLSIYSFSGVTWRHGVQYGIASGLIALLISLYWYYAPWQREDLTFKRMIACFHGGLLSVGLFYLLWTGKLLTKRGDWPANLIFLVGGITLLTICFATFRGSKDAECKNEIKAK